MIKVLAAGQRIAFSIVVTRPHRGARSRGYKRRAKRDHRGNPTLLACLHNLSSLIRMRADDCL
jgi:hypothetical protein